MNTRYSNAYVLSFFLHGAAIAAVLILAYIANQAVIDHPKVFELVAGAGDNYGATEAPALGVPGGIKAALPAPLPPAPIEPTPAPVAETAPPAPAPEPVKLEPVKQPLHHPATSKPVPTKTVPPPTFKQTVQRTASRKAARLERAYRKKLEAEQKRAEAEQKRRMTYDQYVKEHGGKLSSSSRARLENEGLETGVVGGSAANKKGGAGGKALTREDSSLLDAYFSLLRARSHDNFVAPADVNDKLQARVSFYLAADGSISHLHILTSSGNSEFDRAVLDAFRRTHSIGPRPDGKSEEVRLIFSMREEEG